MTPPHLPPCTGDFLRQDNPVYEDLTKFAEVKKFMEEQLEDYNMEPGIIPMGLVLFRDAIEHGMEQYHLCAHPILQLLYEDSTPLNKHPPIFDCLQYTNTSTSVFTHGKQSKTRGGNSLGIGLQVYIYNIRY